METIKNTILAQKEFFASQKTKDISFRIEQLRNFKRTILKYENEIYAALWHDLHKSKQEAFLTEISIVLAEIDLHIRKLRKWAAPKKVAPTMPLLFSKSKIFYEPLGTALIIAPWNYPFQLLMNSLVGAISAGCCAVLKSSPYSAETSSIMQTIVDECFSQNYVALFQGNREVNTFLLSQKFDVIMLTGSPDLGKIAMQAAAKNLTPVILELGGKSPCIVDENADLKIAARRIAWGKTINAGQTCIAPDYLFIHKNVKQKFVEYFADAIFEMYGNDVKTSNFYARIINANAFERLKKLLEQGKIVFGGNLDEKEKYISPTLIDEISPDFPIMKQEIFGPLLPIMEFEKISQVVDYVNNNEKPLAFYYFGKNKTAKQIFACTTSGGGCINDTLMHIANHHLPFGGVGNSGIGKYHGKESFLAFSNARAVVASPVWFDLKAKYAPYKFFEMIKKMV